MDAPPAPPPETVFRLLCPASMTGAVIGKGGAVVRHIREVTGARVRVDDSSSSVSDDERLILVSDAGDHNHHNHNNQNQSSGLSSASAAQRALVMVVEKMAAVDDDEAAAGAEGGGEVGACVRILAAGSEVGCVLGRGGRIVEKIRHDSGAQVRVLSRDDHRIPSCASIGDELIQITGNISAVKKALLSVSGCLQDKPRSDSVNSGSGRLSGRAHHGPENIGGGHRMFIEEDVVFKLLCQVDKVGSLIGKGGSVIRHLQNETGAYIKISDSPADSEERVVVISARENSEQKHSPAQEAVIRVHSRIAEIGFEPGAAVVARLLVHSQQIGCLLGKGGHIISEMRRATGASIRIFTKEQVPKCASLNDEVVQVIGSMHCVQDALFHITGRLRETVIPTKAPHHPNFDMPPPGMFRSRHHPGSPDHSYPYGSERSGPGSTYDRSSSPRMWNHQGGNCGTPRGGGTGDNGPGFSSRKGHLGSENQAQQYSNNSTVEIMVPQNLLPHVYGDNNSHLTQIRQISSAQVLVSDIKPGALEAPVTISGTANQISVAKCLVHAFILYGQTPG